MAALSNGQRRITVQIEDQPKGQVADKGWNKGIGMEYTPQALPLFISGKNTYVTKSEESKILWNYLLVSP